jgi:hypothetical protein
MSEGTLHGSDGGHCKEIVHSCRSCGVLFRVSTYYAGTEYYCHLHRRQIISLSPTSSTGAQNFAVYGTSKSTVRNAKWKYNLHKNTHNATLSSEVARDTTRNNLSIILPEQVPSTLTRGASLLDLNTSKYNTQTYRVPPLSDLSSDTSDTSDTTSDTSYMSDTSDTFYTFGTIKTEDTEWDMLQREIYSKVLGE